MELLIYIFLCFSGVIACIITIKRITLLNILLWLVTMFIIMPSYISYFNNFYNNNFVGYFVSIGIYLFIILFFIYIERKIGIDNFYTRQIKCDTREKSKSAIFAFIEVTILFCVILYLWLGIKTFGSLPWLDWIYGSFAVNYRTDFWIGTLQNVKGATILRFLAKIGLLYLLINEIDLGIQSKVKFTFLFILSILVFTIEGTKSSLLVLLLPLIIFLSFKSKKKYKKVVVLFFLVITIGTLWFSYSEANRDIKSAIGDKIVNRVFMAPSDIALVHYYISKGNFRKGKTNPIINNIVYKKIDIGNAHYYNNFAMRWYRRNILHRAEGNYGSLNAPGFIYGWVNFGFIGLIFIVLFSCINVLFLDLMIYKNNLSLNFLSIAIWFIVIYVTSDDYFNVFWGLEGLFPLLLLDVVNNYQSKVNIYIWVVLGCGFIYNGLLLLSGFI